MNTSRLDEFLFPLPCIVCGKNLEPVVKGDERENNQPLHGLCFIGQGSYGSDFDPMDANISLLINVCDECLTTKGSQGVVVLMRHGRSIKPSKVPPTPRTSRTDGLSIH